MSAQGGGGGAGLGGAIFNDSGTVTIRNSTFKGNTATGGAAGPGAGAGNLAGGAIFSRNGTLTSLNSTFSGNAADTNGGAILVLGDGATATVTVRNTILASNGPEDGKLSTVNAGAVSSAGSGNLVMLNAGGAGAIPGVVSTANPLLGPLQLNAPGNTPTMAITNASPAFNAGDGATCLASDQRGVARPALGGCDIGAFEFAAAADLAVTKTNDAPSPTPVGTDITYTITVTNNGTSDAANVKSFDVMTGTGSFHVVTAHDDPGRTDSCVIIPGFGAVTTTSNVNCTLIVGELAVGETWTTTIVIRGDQPGTITNTLTKSSDTADPNTANDTASNTVTIIKASPTISTTASAPVVVGNNVSDSATLSGGFNPTGTITFMLFGPNNPTCAGAPAFTSAAISVNGNGSYGSGNFATTQAGTYLWIASYSGDPNNNAIAGACGATGESVIVTKATPTIGTIASVSVVVGNFINDSATLSGGFNPTGTITFRLYGPNDLTCANGPVMSSQVNVVSAQATSGSLMTSQAGTYLWIASYSGDPNNNAIAGTCGATGESVIVQKASPVVTTSASPQFSLIGASVSDTATLASGFNPTGTIVFSLYGPNDATCSGAAAFTSAAIPVNGNGSYASGSFTPTAAGTYSWIARYSGDANNNPAAGACALPAETVQITPLIPTLDPLGLLLLMLGLAAVGGIAMRRIR